GPGVPGPRRAGAGVARTGGALARRRLPRRGRHRRAARRRAGAVAAMRRRTLALGTGRGGRQGRNGMSRRNPGPRRMRGQSMVELLIAAPVVFFLILMVVQAV